MATSLLRQKAQSLLTVINGAITHGDWTVDGACDPEAAIAEVNTHLEDDVAELFLMKSSADLAQIGMAAIEAGDWKVRQGYDVSILPRLGAAADRMS